MEHIRPRLRVFRLSLSPSCAREAKENREQKKWPREHVTIFLFRGVFTVTLNGLSERGNTGGLQLDF